MACPEIDQIGTDVAPHVNASPAAASANCEYGCTLAYMVHRLLDFREAELTAVADMYGIPGAALKMRTLPGDSTLSPFRLIDDVSAKQCNQICSRAILTKVNAFRLYQLRV